MMYNWPQFATISGKWDGRYPWGMANGCAYPMMGGVGGGFSFLEVTLYLITWVLLAALLVAAVRYLWKKGGK